jgi:eukaryotic-like serine/threonine-protein kinase
MLRSLPSPGDILGGKYRLERLLGQGGMGAVFEATHLVTGKRVAIKCQLAREGSDAEAMSRFLREAQAAARVSHPNIVDVYDVGEASGTLYLVMQYLDGAPLSSLLGAGPLPIGAAVRTLISAMKGVQAAHRAGVVHRDLKPDNILLCRDAEGAATEPKVLDFGIAKVQSDQPSLAPSLTQSGSVMGTVYYMSPEQAEDARRVDARTDIYALGVILYEVLTGARPFQGASLTAVLLQISRGQFAPMRTLRMDVPEQLEAIVARAMAVDPVQRFQDIAAFIEALEPFAARQGLTASMPLGANMVSPAATDTPLAVESLRPAAKATANASWRVPIAGMVLLLVLGLVLWLRALETVEQAQAPVVSTQASQPEPSPIVAPNMQPTASDPADHVDAPVPAVSPQVPSKAERPRVVTRPKHGQASQPQPKAAAPTSGIPASTPATEGRGRLKVGLSPDQF